jgi:hypothetical protein
MLFLFRKIRKALLTKNKFTTYLLYAAGEIVLVVIGILLAVQLNDYNEKRKDKIKEKVILIALQKELDAAKKDIEYFRGAREYHENLLREYLGQVMDSNLTPNQKAVIPTPTIYSGQSKFIPTYLNSIMYSGDIDLISNDSLKAELSTWQNQMTNIRERPLNAEVYIDYLYERMPQKELVEDNISQQWTNISLHSEEELSTYRIKFVNDFYYHNIIKSLITSHYAFRGALRYTIKMTEDIQEKISQELIKIKDD